MLRSLICATTFVVVSSFSLAIAHADLFVTNEGDSSVRRYTAGGVPVGSGEFVAPGSGGLDRPRALAFGPDGNLYVGNYRPGDSDPGSIVRFNGTTGALIDAFVPAGSNGLGQVYQFAWGPDGNLYVSDYPNNRVQKYDGTTGASLGVFVSGGPAQAEGLTFTPDGLHLLVGWRSTAGVLSYNAVTGAPEGSFGQANNTDSGLVEASSLRFGADGNLYVVDCSNPIDVVKRYSGLGAYLVGFTAGGPAITNSTDGLFDENGDYLVAKYGTIERYDASGSYIGPLVSGTGGLDSGVWLAITPQEEAVPEPSTLGLAALGLASVAATAWKARRARH